MATEKEEKDIMLSLTAEIKCRLSTPTHKKVLFPFAGQDFRNGIIEAVEVVEKDIEEGKVFPPYS